MSSDKGDWGYMNILDKVVENVYDPTINTIEDLPNDKGVYLICAKDTNSLPLKMRTLNFKCINGNPVIYIGISKKQGFKDRDYKNHF